MDSSATRMNEADSRKQLPRLDSLCFVKRVGTYKGMGNPIVVIAFNSKSRFSHDSLRIIANACNLIQMLYFLAVSTEHPSDLQKAVHHIPYLERISVASDVQGCFTTFLQQNEITLLPATMVFNKAQRLVWSGHAQSQTFVYTLQRLRVSSNLPIPPILTNDVLQLPILPISERVTQPSWPFHSRGSISGSGVNSVNSSHSPDEQLRHSVDRRMSDVLPPLSGHDQTRKRSLSRVPNSVNQPEPAPRRSVTSFQKRSSVPADNLNRLFGEILIHSDRIYPSLPYKPSFVPDNPINDKIGMEKLFNVSNRLLCRIK